VAVLPLLPADNFTGNLQEVEGVLRFLQKVPPDLMRQAGLQEAQIPAWDKLKDRLLEAKKQQDERDRKEKESEEAEAKANLTKEIEDWQKQADDFRISRTEKELMDLKQKGETLARQSPEKMETILQALAVLSQVQPKEKGEPLPDLQKLNDVQPRLVPDDLLGWLAGGVLILSFFGLLFGLAFLSSSLTRFKEGALLGGIVFGVVAAGILGVLTWTWLPAQVTGEVVPPRADPKMEELGIYLKNRARPVYYFPAKEFSFSAEEWRSGVLGYLPVSEESVGLFKVKMKEGKLWLMQEQWIWQQPLTALGIPLPFQLTFEGPIPELKEWENPVILKVSLGRWPIPDSIAGLLKDSASSVLRQGLGSGGLEGVRLDKDDKGMILISVPAAGTRPKYELAKEEPTKVDESASTSVYKKEISSEELFQQIEKGLQKEFIGKFILLEGFVIRLESGSEISGALVAQKQTPSDLNKNPTTFGQKDFDKFYMAVERPSARWNDGKKTKSTIKCLIKSDLVFAQDNDRGDIYLGPIADTVDREPFIKWGQRVQFLTEGRVEGLNKFGEFEIYGIRLDPDKLKEQIRVFDPNDPKPK